MNKSALKLTLERLLVALKQQGMQAPFSLTAGLKRQEISDRLQQHDIPLSEEIIGFYEVCNGIDANKSSAGDPPLFHWFVVLTFNGAIRHYEQLIENDEEHRPEWFPFLYVDSGDYYCIDAQAADKEEPCILSRPLEFDSSVVFQNVSTMMTTILDCYIERVFTIENGRVIDAYDKKEALIALRHNPEVAFWQEEVAKL